MTTRNSSKASASWCASPKPDSDQVQYRRDRIHPCRHRTGFQPRTGHNSANPVAVTTTSRTPMPRINLTEFDIYGILDADTPEAHAFTTYLAYWDCLERSILEIYGDDPHTALLAELQSRKAYNKLKSRPFRGNDELLRSLLLNGWNSEQNLYLVDEDDPRVSAQTQWINVYAYYSSGKTALAWILTQQGAAPNSHRNLLRALVAQANSALIPAPWQFSCTTIDPTPAYHGFATDPAPVSNLAADAPCQDMAAKMLKTTRRKRIDDLIAEEKTRTGRKRAKAGTKKLIDTRTEATTIFDFMYRSRARANYGDPSMFYMGHLNEHRSRNYLTAVKNVTSTTMFLFEALIAQRAPDTLVNTAIHWMTRDRSGISDQVLKPRLQTLGLIAET